MIDNIIWFFRTNFLILWAYLSLVMVMMLVLILFPLVIDTFAVATARGDKIARYIPILYILWAFGSFVISLILIPKVKVQDKKGKAVNANAI
jgi:hypothetical protein